MITQVHSVGFTVSDMEQALHFYTQVLPFQKIHDVVVWGEPYDRLTGIFGVHRREVTLQLGTEHLYLTQYLTPPGGRPIPVDSRSHDLWFQHIAIVVSDMAAAYDLLRAQHVQHVSTAPQTLPATIPAAAGIQAFYFRDNDGHNLELIGFPAGKGQPRWQNTHTLFLGIDHTAIAVAATATSRRIYETTLGLQLAGESINYGTEQEHLNGVFGCRVHITGWRPHAIPTDDIAAGLGIEFLEYVAPPGGHPMPADTRANDLWHWETTLISDALEQDFNALKTISAQFISAEIVTLPPDNFIGGRRAFMVRDVDGHALKIVER